MSLYTASSPWMVMVVGVSRAFTVVPAGVAYKKRWRGYS